MGIRGLCGPQSAKCGPKNHLCAMSGPQHAGRKLIWKCQYLNERRKCLIIQNKG